MKNLWKLAVVIVAVSVRAQAATAPTLPLLGVNSTTAGYIGSSTFTVVDQANTTANLIFNNLTLTGTLTTAGTQINTGSVINNGSETSNNITVYTPFSATLSTFTQISANNGTYQNLISTGVGSVLLQGGGAGNLTGTLGTCVISTTTATNGQMIVFGSTTSVNYVILSTGSVACISTTIAPLTTLNRTFTLFFDSAAALWKGN